MKDQGCLIGRRVVFCGSSPLLYLAALQMLRVGGEALIPVDIRIIAATNRLPRQPLPRLRARKTPRPRPLP